MYDIKIPNGCGRMFIFLHFYIEASHRLLCFRMTQADARHSTLVQCTMHI
jgi:hypothetical protein